MVSLRGVNENGVSTSEAPFRVVLGVSGGIAAYKAVILARLLRKAGIDLRIIPTPSALGMVGATTWEAIGGHEVTSSVTDHADTVDHVRFGTSADLIIVAPATANTLAKARAGIADNLLLNTLLAATCPVVFAPAMHTQMWLNPATQENARVLAERGYTVLEPARGALTGKDSGLGRLPEPEDLAAFICDVLARSYPERSRQLDREAAGIAGHSYALNEITGDGRAVSLALNEKARAALAPLRGLRIAISAGGTHEPIDPVRYIANHSTGTFGIALARTAALAGANVSLISANIEARRLEELDGAQGVECESVTTARQLHAAMMRHADVANVVIMCAAVADYSPVHVAPAKVKKGSDPHLSIELRENPDILRELATARKAGQIVVGFAAETGDESHTPLEYGLEKAGRKGTDLMVVNEVGEAKGFGERASHIFLVRADRVIGEASGSKSELAVEILHAVASLI